MIIGCGGSGKTTIAARLGERLSLPVHHLDRMFWRPCWIETPHDEWRTIQERICRQAEWVIDGNYGATMDIRLIACDTVIFLDLPSLTCLFGAVKRFLRFWGHARPDMAEGCSERLSWDYLKWIWTYRKTRRPLILSRLQNLKDAKRIVILTSRRAIRCFLENAPETHRNGVSLAY